MRVDISTFPFCFFAIFVSSASVAIRFARGVQQLSPARRRQKALIGVARVDVYTQWLDAIRTVGLYPVLQSGTFSNKGLLVIYNFPS